MHTLPLKSILISPHRQRREFTQESISELAESIAKNGLLHPPVIRKGDEGWVLVAGERRLRAVEYLWATGGILRMGEATYEEGTVPCNYVGELDPLEAFEAELEENIRRVDLPWQDRTRATAQLHSLRQLQFERGLGPEPTVNSIAAEKDDTPVEVRAELLVASHLSDPDVAQAASAKEALKILKRKEEVQRNIELGELIGRSFSSDQHTLLKGDCIQLMSEMKPEQFDIILTDPPYGIDADQFNDSGGKALGPHGYDDSYSNWSILLRDFAQHIFRLAKQEAHVYCFCDIDNFLELRDIMANVGWEVFRTPIIWFNPQGMRAPWPSHGPQRKYQLILYAMKGKKNVLHLKGDVITSLLDPHEGYPAQKPVEVYMELLRRSARPGDFVLDPFCGSGTIFPAAHALKLRATGVELDASAYGIASRRLKELG
jgi:site-specific DNA-methyltransferase (adenine-specific)